MIAMYVPQSRNRKTGNIPQQYLGVTRKQSRSSCKGCSLLNNGCYAQGGTPALAHGNMIHSGKTYTLKGALKGRAFSAKAFRFGSLGDPSALGRRAYLNAYQAVRKAGLTVRSYTHFWRRVKWLKGYALASCDNMYEARAAVSQGWRAAVVVDDPAAADTRELTRELSAARCPHELDKRVTCNDCRICDPEFDGLQVVIFKFRK